MIRRFAALVGPLVAAVAFTPAAVAGPMSWTYTATVQAGTTGGTPPASAVLSLSRFDKAESGGGAFAPLPTGSTGVADGDATIVLAASSKSQYTTGDPTGAEVDGFRTLLQITDQASGVRGFTYMNGTGSLVGGPADAGALQLDGAGRVQMLLGKNRYDIAWHRQDAESVSRIVADVNVSAVTPEPATLVLAGLGLSVIGVRRWRK